MNITAPVSGRARRRWLLVALGLLSIIAGLIAALPWLLQTPVVQRRMAAYANNVLAPGSVEFGAIRLSWFRQTEISRFVLHDAHGDRLISAPLATFGWNLWQILVTRPETVDLVIQQGDLDIERGADGTVDLYETLRPVISENPPIRLKIIIENGRLRFRDPMFSDPVVADQAKVILDLGRNSEPITWDIQLADTQMSGGPVRLGIVGNYSREQVDPSGRHDLALSLKGSRWPWSLANPLVQTRGELTGNVDGDIRMGRVRITGDATITNLVAIGDLFSSDTVHLETAHARLSAEELDGAWSIDTLDLTSPVGSVKGEGLIPPTPKRGAWLEANVDLASLAKQLRTTLHLRDDVRVEHGAARLRADVRLNADGHTEDWNVTGKISDLTARQGEKMLTLPEPATLVAKLERDQAAIKLERFDVQSTFLKATARGDLDRGIALTASLDLAAFRERFRDWIDLGKVELAGQGQLDGLYRRQGELYRAEVNAKFRDLRLGGLPIIQRIQRDQMTIEGKIGGRSTASGWPLSWSEVSLHALSGETELTMSAQPGAVAGELAVSGRASTSLELSGRQCRLEGELKAKSSQSGWTTDRLALAAIRPSKWGPGVGPDEAIRWEGTGRYDPQRDELSVESIASPPRPLTENETWISGDQKLRASGLRSLGAARIEVAANADLGSLGLWLSPNGPAWKGSVDALAHARRDGERWNVGTRIELRDPSRTSGDGPAMGLSGSALVEVNAGYAPRSDLLEVTELTVKAPNVQVDGGGVVRNLTGRPQLDLKGSLDLDWEAVRTFLASKVEPNANIAGRPRAWRLAGTIDGLPAFDHMGSLEGEIGVQIDSLDVFGMRLSGVPVVLRSAAGRLTVDPVDAKLNGGDLHLEPVLVRGKDGATWLHLGPESSLVGAVVNDEVSHRVLSFAAPVLDGATRVEGRVSVKLAEAYLPVLATAEAQVQIQGDVLFDDFRFMAGPLAEQLLSVFQRERRPLAVLRDPIAVRIVGRTVYQEGLSIPVANIATIGLNGSVDFDQKLDMVARFALVPPRSNVPVLTPLMANARFDLPIRGTLKNPKIDGEALKDHWQAIGTNLLGNSVEAGVNTLGKILQGLPVGGLRGLMPQMRRNVPRPPPEPAVPNDDDGPAPADRESPQADHEVLKPSNGPAEAPAPLTRADRLRLREQRRQERLQKKADRRAKQVPQ